MKLIQPARAVRSSRMRPVDLVPRFRAQGYAAPTSRSDGCGSSTRLACAWSTSAHARLPTEQMRGNIENPIGTFRCRSASPARCSSAAITPAARSMCRWPRPRERSSDRSSAAWSRLTRAGGVTTRIHVDENRVCPVFVFDSVSPTRAGSSTSCRSTCRRCAAEAESTTRHGRLLRVEPRQIGRDVIVAFCYHTGDAQGMNMIVKATERACEWLMRQRTRPAVRDLQRLQLGEARERGAADVGQRQDRHRRRARSGRIARSCLHATPTNCAHVWHRAAIGHSLAGAIGCNAQLANGLTALFIACGQDVANVANAHVGITNFEMTATAICTHRSRFRR